jgi:CRP/FNR family cyclic AMP-dependent transcriptional regulator
MDQRTPKQLNLSSIEVFSGLTARELVSVSDLCQEQCFQIDDQVIGQMSDTQGVYFISRGSVRVINLTTSGKEVTLEVLSEGKCFGELAAIDSGPRSSSVIAIKPTLLFLMSAPNFLKTMEKYPSVSLNIMSMLAKVIRTSSERITNLVTLGANARVLAEVIKKIKEQGYDKNINKILIQNFPKHSELARRASTTRETVTRVLSTLSKKNIIRRNSSTLEVSDIAVLERTFLNLSNSDIR